MTIRSAWGMTMTDAVVGPKRFAGFDLGYVPTSHTCAERDHTALSLFP